MHPFNLNPIVNVGGIAEYFCSTLREESLCRKIMPPKPLVPSVMDLIRDALRAENEAHGKA